MTGTARPARALLLCVLALVPGVAACTSTGSGSAPTPSAVASAPGGSAGASPSTDAATSTAPDARPELASLVARSAGSSHTLVYRVLSTPGTTLTLRRAGTAGRLDIAIGTTTTSVFTTPSGVVVCLGGACATAPAAAGGAPGPGGFDPRVQRELEGEIAGVAPANPGVAVRTDGTQAGETCFALSGAPSGASRVCVRADGVVTELRYPSGTLSLASEGTPPAPADLRPRVG